MASSEMLIRQAYSAFNDRDIEHALVLMNEQVSWPTASEGGRVIGKAEIRAYWTRQWAEFDPRVEPLKIVERESGTLDVTVHQLVKDLDGAVLSDQHLVHTFHVLNGLIERMDIGESAPAFQRGTAPDLQSVLRHHKE